MAGFLVVLFVPLLSVLGMPGLCGFLRVTLKRESPAAPRNQHKNTKETINNASRKQLQQAARCWRYQTHP